MLAVDAGAARALHDLACERWANATGQSLPPPDPRADPWPLDLMPTLIDVDVGIARTLPPHEGSSPVTEVRSLYLDLIASARHYVYIENQYFTAKELGDALAERLKEPNGPEVIVVLRHLVTGLVEGPAMGTMRTVLLRRLFAADRYGRFRAYYPSLADLPANQGCELHSKVMIVDDEWLRVGSANFANRSMGLDAECDLLIEARGEPRTTRAIASCRNRLLGEHLGMPEGAVHEAIQRHAALCAAVESLRSEGTHEQGRTLEPFEKLTEPSVALVAVAAVADPEPAAQFDPNSVDQTVIQTSSFGASLTPVITLAALFAAGLTLFWHYGPAAALNVRIAQLAGAPVDNPWVPLLVVAAYTPASIVLFPRPLITLFSVLALGPLVGFECSFTGAMISAAVTFLGGRRLDRALVRRLAGRRLSRVSRFLYHRGTLAMAAVRLVPLAPFAVVNVVAGAMGVRARCFLAGTALGLLPGTLVATLFGDELTRWLHDPHSIDIGLCAAALAALLTSGWSVRHWFGTGSLPGRGTNGRVATAAQ